MCWCFWCCALALGINEQENMEKVWKGKISSRDMIIIYFYQETSAKDFAYSLKEFIETFEINQTSLNKIFLYLKKR